ncbi:hypothetical protein F2P81_001468 [Scophthalmus maximus]|uniref:Uncharacterized protein n=1 Tax=Scophthalmus maximus TaxID=52904 RepID=A0A6A4TJF3_SCOMX|nr:hypothetical protein F2P81_001468 [Scophthalmus maximus]
MEPSTLATQRWKFSVPANVLQQCLHMITEYDEVMLQALRGGGGEEGERKGERLTLSRIDIVRVERGDLSPPSYRTRHFRRGEQPSS